MKKKTVIIIIAALVAVILIAASCALLIKDDNAGGNVSEPESSQSSKAEESLSSESSSEISSSSSSSSSQSSSKPSSSSSSSSSQSSSAEESSLAPKEEPEESKPEEKPEKEPEKEPEKKPIKEENYVDKVEVVDDLPEEEQTELLPTLKPAEIAQLNPEASGELVESGDTAVIDYSNNSDGYVMVKFTENTDKAIRVQIVGPSTTYTYIVSPGSWEVFPLSDGSGDYQVKVFKNVVDKKYSLELSLSLSVQLDSEFAPFLRPNQYVDYENAPNTVSKAASLVAGKSGVLDKVDSIYSYVVGTLSYDYDKAEKVSSGYLPNLDKVLSKKKGICFDYASLMAGMLRSQNVPCKLVVGYADETYHAWISVWSAKTGWIDGAIFFDGVSWQRMDPTFASSMGSDALGDINYTAKYFY